MVRIMQRAKSKFYLSEINSATSKEFVCHMQQAVRIKKLDQFPNIYLINQLPAIFNDSFY